MWKLICEHICLVQSAEQVTGICRTKERGKRNHLQHQRSSEGVEERPSNMTLAVERDSPPLVISGASSPSHSQLSFVGARDAEKMKKIVLELLDTERAYVK
ncbi:unnamed protein product, partial [Allacma fusca]